MEKDFTKILSELKRGFFCVFAITLISIVILGFSFLATIFNQSLLSEMLLFPSLLALSFGFYCFKILEEKNKSLELRKRIDFIDVYTGVRKKIFFTFLIYLSVLLLILASLFMPPKVLGEIQMIVLILPAIVQAIVSFNFLMETGSLIGQVSRNEQEHKAAGLI
jgi:hypothetical protein